MSGAGLCFTNLHSRDPDIALTSTENIYLALTAAFNSGRTRAILSSGQAVVLHRLAMMSKDGDWIVRELQDDLDVILAILEENQATYRFGAPLDERWLAGGWSSHFEFVRDGTRVRCDFFSRPPRLSKKEIQALWATHDGESLPYLDIPPLVKVKQTQREKDYPIIGELARKLPPAEQLIWGRSARDLIQLAGEFPAETRIAIQRRPFLDFAIQGDRDELEAALDKERRSLMRMDEQRLAGYTTAATRWRGQWPEIQAELANFPLRQAHLILVQKASGVLPACP